LVVSPARSSTPPITEPRLFLGSSCTALKHWWVPPILLSPAHRSFSSAPRGEKTFFSSFSSLSCFPFRSVFGKREFVLWRRMEPAPFRFRITSFPLFTSGRSVFRPPYPAYFVRGNPKCSLLPLFDQEVTRIFLASIFFAAGLAFNVRICSRAASFPSNMYYLFFAPPSPPPFPRYFEGLDFSPARKVRGPPFSATFRCRGPPSPTL